MIARIVASIMTGKLLKKNKSKEQVKPRKKKKKTTSNKPTIPHNIDPLKLD